MSTAPDPETAAEAAVLGSLLSDTAAAWPAVATLSVDDFTRGPHAAIFGAIATLARAGVAADPVTTADALEASGLLEVTGGLATLARLQRGVLAPANAGAYARLVVEASQRRFVAKALDAARGAIERREAPLCEILPELQASLASAIERGAVRGDISLADAASDAMADIEQRVERRAAGGLVGIPTGLERLDLWLGGLQPGLIVIAGLTGTGKSSLVGHLAIAAAEAGFPAGIVSLEMTAREIARRALSRVHAVDLGGLMSGGEKAFYDVAEAESAKPLGRLPIRLDDSASRLDEVLARIAMWHGRHAVRVAVVDYLQLVTSADAENRQLEVARISRELKRTSLALKIPIIGISQFSRAAAAAATAGERPELHFLRDSGSIEQDSDVVIALWRTVAQRDADTQDRPKQLCLSVLKNRHGLAGDVYGPKSARGPLMFDANVQAFREYRRSDAVVDGGAMPSFAGVGPGRTAGLFDDHGRRRSAS